MEPLGSAEWDLVKSADAGSAEAQNDLALVLMSLGQPSAALYWFEQAAAQDYQDALFWMANAYIGGVGVPVDQDRGLMYLARAAMTGHTIAKAQTEAIRAKVSRT